MKQKTGGGGFSRVLKWVGYLTAILSLGATLAGIAKYAYGRVETTRKVDLLLGTEGVQLDAHDYWSAWRTLEQASKLAPDSPKVRSARESLAMAWLEDVHLTEGQKFSDITQKVEPVLTAAVAALPPGPRRADLRAHIGFAYFLQTRDARFDLDPAVPYAEAVSEDHNNPYAQAMWGHWILWQHCDNISEAAPHFAAAIESHRLGDYVRQLQLSALLNCQDDDAAVETIRAANAMRQEQRSLDEWSRDHIYGLYFFALNYNPHSPEAVRFINAVPPAEHVATFRWLFDKTNWDTSRRVSLAYYLAVLQEAAGQRDDAMNSYRAVLRQVPSKDNTLGQAADAAIQRLSHSSGGPS